MYLDFFGLHEKPFSIAPNPDYLFLTDQHKEALAHLRYGIGDEGGFVLLTGEIGTGKTTICRSMLSQLPEDADLAFVINPRLSPSEMLEAVCDDFGVPYESGSSIRTLIAVINEFLLEAYAKGRNAILVIDEAQNLSEDVLEQLRLLTNLETNEKKLLQLILIGQPELKEKLGQYSMRQLAQRITASFHLESLSYQETVDYIAHRLYVAGFRGELFSNAALKHIYRKSGGTPRLINIICDRAMLGAYTTGVLKVEFPLVENACEEVLQVGAGWSGQADYERRKTRRFLLYLGIALLAMLAIYLFGLGDNWFEAEERGSPGFAYHAETMLAPELDLDFDLNVERELKLNRESSSGCFVTERCV